MCMFLVPCEGLTSFPGCISASCPVLYSGQKCKLRVYYACAINVIEKTRATLVQGSENVGEVCDQAVSKNVYKCFREGYYGSDCSTPYYKDESILKKINTSLQRCGQSDSENFYPVGNDKCPHLLDIRAHWMVWREIKWCKSYCMLWHPQAPNFNPIEHLWEIRD